VGQLLSFNLGEKNMITDLQYALMAGNVYRSTRPDINKVPIPVADGWQEIPNTYVNLASSGFEAASFQRGTDIVISYTGTGTAVDWIANIALGIGWAANQLRQAAAYYMQVKTLNQNANITFTGHSLGGGLASLIAVFFDKTAVTFDQAPFAASAKVSIRNDLTSYLLSLKDANQQPLYTSQQLTTLAPEFMGFTGLDAARAGKVTGFIVQGEVLSNPFSPTAILSQIGAQTTLNHGTPPGPNLLLATDLHSQTLMSAFLQSDQSKLLGLIPSSFRDVSVKLPDLIKLIFNGDLYSFPTADPTNENFIERLVRHEFGNAPLAATADAMLTRFTKDIIKLAQDGGLTLVDDPATGTNWLSRALIVFALQKYYDERTTSAGYNKELFSYINGTSGGIRFDITDVAPSWDKTKDATAATANNFRVFLNNYYTSLDANGAVTYSPDKDVILAALSSLRDWYIQAGAAAINASDTFNRGAANDDQYAIQIERKAA
jgi:hypothetical protein